MSKGNITFAILGLIVGLVGGFFGANYINRNTATQVQANAQQLPQVLTQPAQNGAAPAAGTTGGAMIPEIQAVLDKAKNEPDNFDVQKEAGMMYYRIGRFDESLKYMTEAHRIKPDDFDTKVTLGNIHFSGGNFQESERMYAAALEQQPDNVAVRTDMGLTFFFRTPPDFDRAIAEYRKSLTYNPRHELTLQNLCGALREKGDKEGLAEAIKQLEAVNPNNAALARLKEALK